jgi:cobyrinic acid a,c-diamide synthase
MGCLRFDPEIDICGVILNRVAGKRHEGKVRANIEKFCKVPVLGAIPKLKAEDFPERHMGLVTSLEHGFSQKAVAAAAKVASDCIDLDKLYARVTRKSDQVTHCSVPEKKPLQSPSLPLPGSVTIGIVKDSAFQFYYPDNIDALKKQGADIVYISPLSQKQIPDNIHAIYMGGGFPETHAHQLAENTTFRDRLKTLSENGLPIYAECGGLIFLGKSICLDGKTYPMSGILPVNFGLSNRPQGHGYTRVEVVMENPFYKKGDILKGHEFRYSKIMDIDYTDKDMAFRMERGKGIVDKKDGFFKHNTFGTYTHIHALGTVSWAGILVKKALAYKQTQKS